MTWIGMWTLRAVVVFLGIFCAMLALNLLGLNKSDNPFTSWGGLIQAIALACTVSALLLIEFVIEKMGWVITIPKLHFGDDLPPSPPQPPFN
jgi:hypothetical protein